MTLEKSDANAVIAKRRCMYLFLILVMFVIATNIGITALLLYYINISKHSIGNIRLDSSRTLIHGNVFAEKSLVAEKVSSFNGSLQFIGSEAIHLESGQSAIVLSSDLLLQGNSFKVLNKNGEDIFQISPEVSRISSRTVKLSGKAQALKSLQAKQIFSRTNMKIASPTKKLLVHTVDDFNIDTAIGSIKIQALSDIDLEAKNITLGTKNVYVPELKGIEKFTTSGSDPSIYEVCLCPDGTVFAAKLDVGCVDTSRAQAICVV